MVYRMTILTDMAISLAGSAITWVPAIIYVAGWAAVSEAIKSFGGDFKRAMRDARGWFHKNFNSVGDSAEDY